MLNFERMKDVKLKKWINIYESIPIVRVLIDKKQYKKAIIESFKRFESDELERYFYFSYINTEGVPEHYETWKNKINIQ